MITLWIPGVPVPQGSKTVARGGGKVWLRDSNGKSLKPWRQTIAEHADIGHTFDVPVFIAATFFMPRPQRPKFLYPAVMPDLDKLQRALGDGLTDGGLLKDDARVTRWDVRKRYPDERGPGVVLVIVQDEGEQ